MYTLHVTFTVEIVVAHLATTTAAFPHAHVSSHLAASNYTVRKSNRFVVVAADSDGND
jgi:hypothetical protein